MQVLAEAYDSMRTALNMSARECSEVFRSWNRGELNSYLVEIAGIATTMPDAETGALLVNAEQKGTGMWTSHTAWELGVPVPSLTAAVEARELSTYRRLRVRIAGNIGVLPTLPMERVAERRAVLSQLRDGVFVCMALCNAQGFHLLRRASSAYRYHLPLSDIARIRKGGCIVRAAVLDSVQQAYAVTLNTFVLMNYSAQCSANAFRRCSQPRPSSIPAVCLHRSCMPALITSPVSPAHVCRPPLSFRLYVIILEHTPFDASIAKVPYMLHGSKSVRRLPHRGSRNTLSKPRIATVNSSSFGRYFPEHIRRLQCIGTVKRFTVPASISGDQLGALLSGYRYIVASVTPQFPRSFFDTVRPDLRFVVRHGIGYNNVNVTAAESTVSSSQKCRVRTSGKRLQNTRLHFCWPWYD